MAGPGNMAYHLGSEAHIDPAFDYAYGPASSPISSRAPLNSGHRTYPHPHPHTQISSSSPIPTSFAPRLPISVPSSAAHMRESFIRPEDYGQHRSRAAGMEGGFGESHDLDDPDDDGRSQYSVNLGRHGHRSQIYDRDTTDSDRSVDDDDMLLSDDDESDSVLLGANIDAILDKGDETTSSSDEKEIMPEESNKAPGGGARWRGFEFRALLQAMHDLNVLDPNLESTQERNELWEKVAEVVTNERKKQGSIVVRTVIACKNAWSRVYKAHCADKRIGEIATGTDEADGSWQRRLDDLAGLWNDLRTQGKSAPKKQKPKLTSEKMRDEDLKGLDAKPEKSDKEGGDEGMDEDLNQTPRRTKKLGRNPPGSQMMAQRTTEMITAFTDIAAKQQASFSERLEREEKMQKAELEAADRRHEASLGLDKEKMVLEQRREREHDRRIQQLEDQIRQNQRANEQRHNELQTQFQAARSPSRTGGRKRNAQHPTRPTVILPVLKSSPQSLHPV
ncbi:hypothetical protein CF319_g7423 [Tilletia indica]|nr:hypothetical protein CF319_g7423 [Tilletia indica]